MIVKIKFLTKDLKTETWMFGNSYKTWFEQFNEFVWSNVSWWDTNIIMKCEYIKVLDVEVSQSSWVSWGGLKWCREDYFQANLNREGRQEKEPDNPNPRLYVNMRFKKSSYMLAKCRKFFNNRLRKYKNLNKYQVGSNFHSTILKNLKQDLESSGKPLLILNTYITNQ